GLAEQLAQAVEVDRLEVAGEQLLLETPELIHGAHELERLLVGERLRPVEEVTVAALEVLERPDVVQLLEELVEQLAGSRVLETGVAQALERFGQPVGQPVEQLAQPGRPLRIPTLRRRF